MAGLVFQDQNAAPLGKVDIGGTAMSAPRFSDLVHRRKPAKNPRWVSLPSEVCAHARDPWPLP